jgi:hypothetical protein
MADEGSRGGTRVVVVVAIVGLLSTLSASLVTGVLTVVAGNVQFENQRAAESENKRREVYANYQNSVTKVCQVDAEVYGFGKPPTTEEKAGLAKINAALINVINLNGQVQLFAHSEQMQKAADELTKTMVADPDQICGSNAAFLESQHRLIDAAKADLQQ